MDLEDLIPALDGKISSGDVLLHGHPHHGATLLAQHRLRDLFSLLEHGDGLPHVDGPLHFRGDLLGALESVASEWA